MTCTCTMTNCAVPFKAFHLLLAQHVSLRIAFKNVARPHRRLAACSITDINSGSPSGRVVAERAAEDGGIATIDHPHAAVGVARDLAALQPPLRFGPNHNSCIFAGMDPAGKEGTRSEFKLKVFSRTTMAA